MTESYSREFLRVMSILEDYLPDIVLVGGCVPYIYWKYMFETQEAIVDGLRGCVGPREIETLTSRLRPLFSDEYSPGTRDVAAQLSSLGMAEGNMRLLVLLEFGEFLSLLSP